MNARKLQKPVGYGAITLIFVLFPLAVSGQYPLYIMTMACIAILMAASLRVVFESGQLSMGHGGLMAIGAYTAALLVMKMGWSSWGALAAAAAAGGLLSLIVGFPFVRLKGIYFSLITVFLGTIIGLIFEQWKSLTGGSFGITGIPAPNPIKVPGLPALGFGSKMSMYYMVMLIVLVCLVILYLIEHSRIGITFASIRESDFLTESVGVNTSWYKVLAFTIGGLFAGLAGGLYSQFNHIITPTGFGFIYSVYVMIYVVVGGSRNFLGPIIGAVIFTIIPEVARPLRGYQPFIFAGALMLVVFFLPDGLVSLPRLLFDVLRRRRSELVAVREASQEAAPDV